MDNLPFLALIIGPYSQKNRNESLLKVFHLVKEKQPFSLNYRVLPAKKLRKGLVQELKDILLKYQNHQDRINLREKWGGSWTREDKLGEAIDMMLQRNYRSKDRHDIFQSLQEQLSPHDLDIVFGKQSI